MTDIKLPKTPALMADRLYKIKELKSELAAKTKLLDDERIAIEAALINLLPKDESTGIQGKVARASLIVKEVPQAEDWDKIHAYIKKTGSWDLLTRSLKATAVQERWDDGKKIPGIVAFTKIGISLNKV